jgi:DNA-binding response OmpR family regulator
MPDMPMILVVERTRRNLELLVHCLSEYGYQTLTGANLEEFDQILAAPKEIALALVDIGGFDRRIWQRCEQLLEKQVPFFVLAHQHSAAIQYAGIAHGARGVLIKPLTMQVLLGSVRSLLTESL